MWVAERPEGGGEGGREDEEREKKQRRRGVALAQHSFLMEVIMFNAALH